MAQIYTAAFWRSLLAIFIINICFLGCSKQSDTTPLSIVAYNHTDTGIGEYSVKISTGASGGAGYLDAGAGGGGFTCCVSVPLLWRAGLKATVTKAITVDELDATVERIVEIPKYDLKNASLFAIHFLRNGDVKVFVTGLSLGHRDYPLKGTEADLKAGVPLKIRWP